MKRQKYISWDQYFMGVAKLAALRSKDPSTQVGCCIVSNDKKVLSQGYNGFPKGCSDDEFPWEKGNDDPYDNKYYYVVHAELNAILNAKTNLDGSTLYVTLFPCQECTKAIIQSGIKKVIYARIKESDIGSPEHRTSLRMFEAAGVELVNDPCELSLT